MVAIIERWIWIYCQLSPSSHDHRSSPKIFLSLGTVGARKFSIFIGNRKFINCNVGNKKTEKRGHDNVGHTQMFVLSVHMHMPVSSYALRKSKIRLCLAQHFDVAMNSRDRALLVYDHHEAGGKREKMYWKQTSSECWSETWWCVKSSFPVSQHFLLLFFSVVIDQIGCRFCVLKEVFYDKVNEKSNGFFKNVSPSNDQPSNILLSINLWLKTKNFQHCDSMLMREVLTTNTSVEKKEIKFSFS